MSCTNLKDIDIFQRTLKCRDLPKMEEPEMEIFEVESTEPLEEETAVEQQTFYKCDPEGVYHEAECVKRRIQKLLLVMKAGGEPCPLISSSTSEIKLTCCEELEICRLQKEQHKLQFQINKLLKAFQTIQKEIHDLHAYICKQSKDIEQLQLLILFLQYWQKGLKPDEGVCHKRYVYIKDHKADWADIKDLLKNEERCPEKLCQKYLLKKTHKMNNIDLQADLEKLKALYVELFEMKRPNSELTAGKSETSAPLKQIEIDFIESQVKKNKKLEKQDCQRILKCDKVDL